MNKKIMGTAVSLIVGIGLGYASATVLHPAARAQNARGFAGAAGGNFAGARAVAAAGAAGGRGGTAGSGGGFLTGTVAAKDSRSITLNTRDGNSHVVLISPATTVSKSVNGSQTDVSVGSNITVSGTTNGDSSISASLIQLRPAGPPAAQQ